MMPLRRSTLSALAVLSLSLVLSGCADAETQSEASPDEAAAQSGIAPKIHNAASKTVLEYRVDGLHCDGCAATLKSRLASLNGVLSCDVSFEDSHASVHVSDPAVASTVVAKVEELGYTIAPQDRAPGINENADGQNADADADADVDAETEIDGAGEVDGADAANASESGTPA